MIQKISIEDLCMKLKPIFGKKIDEIYMKYVISDSLEEKDEITRILNTLYQKNLNQLLDKKVLLEPPTKETVEGEYPLAMVNYADRNLYPFSLREQDWIRHVCISGMSGSGKTTLAYHVINNFIQKGKPFLIFDWKKSFRPLVFVDSNIMCFTIGRDISNNLKININEPPKGVSPKEWINVLCDLLAESFFVSYGVQKILLETLDDSFKEWGIYNGSENYPTWNHIKWRLEEKMNKAKGREAGWIESALRIATVLTFGDFGKVCNYKGEDKFNVEELLDKRVILELNSLGNTEKKFFCEFILTYIYKYKKVNQNHLNDAFKYAILVDEAHNIFLKQDTHFVKESITDMIYREIREYGVSLICLDQHISKLSDCVKGNSACHIAFQQQLPQDIYDASNLMQLIEKRNFFTMLPVGTAIVKLSERYSAPFLVQVPNVEFKNREVTDNDIKERMRCLLIKRDAELGVDKDFNHALMPKIEEEKAEEIKIDNKIQEEKIEIKEKQDQGLANPLNDREVPLTNIQKVLYDFVDKKLCEGANILELERLMEKNVGVYSPSDVLIVINYALKRKLETLDYVTTLKGKLYKEQPIPKISELGEEQQKFISFLEKNPNHDYSTVEFYTEIGLSSRKGNKIKDELLQKNLIVVEEEKNEKGWKKLIRLNR
ncbi:MAG: DUF87 domain-containing protein [Candidatus Parcubacteria bacterium]|nr:DUF87 domain-containing protein [Candidatus Parcubacteria bacterium]